MTESTIAQLERDLGAPETRVQAATQLAALALTSPELAWPCLVKWCVGDDEAIREAVGEAVTTLLEHHFDIVVADIAREAAADQRFGNLVLSQALRFIHGKRYTQLQKHLRAEFAARDRALGIERPTIDSILDDDDLDYFAMDLLDHLLGREQPSESEKVALLILMLNVEHSNGGLAQYYFNSAGNEAHELPSALRAVGAAQHAAIVEAVNALFGPTGPSPDPEERRRQIGMLERDHEAEWKRLLDHFDDVRVDYVRRLRRYARSHRKDFGAV